MPNHYVGDLLPTIGMSGLSRVRTELLQLAVVMALAPHPVQMHRQFPSHRHLGDLPPAPHGKVKELAAPLGLAAHRDLRRFHQQKAQQHVALFADVSQSTTISAGLFRRHQAYVAGDLFAAMKTLRRSDYQLEGQRRQGVRLRGASPSAASQDVFPLLVPRHPLVAGFSALVDRVSRADPAAGGSPKDATAKISADAV